MFWLTSGYKFCQKSACVGANWFYFYSLISSKEAGIYGLASFIPASCSGEAISEGPDILPVFL